MGKKMNEIYTGKSKANLPPIQIQPPSMGSVLDMLNIINGILFVQISQQDIENFKMEYEKRQKESDKSGSGDSSSKNSTENSAEENDKNAKSSSSNSQSRDNSEEKNEI